MNSLPEFQLELMIRIGEVLHYIWDPIGISEFSAARDEYDMYVPQVFDLLLNGAKADEIADLLNRIEEEQIGLTANRQRAEKAAVLACEWVQQLSRQRDRK